MKINPKLRINNWRGFAKHVRKKNENLLSRLPEFINPILVTGCQRSGTTLLTQIIMASEGIVDYRRGADSELDGALILCGRQAVDPGSDRYCFQTTYLNERYPDYFQSLGKFKLVFIVRNPDSVVYSMCNHWGGRIRRTNFALNELFLSCGQSGLSVSEKRRVDFLGSFGVPKLRKACLAYVGKTSQLFELYDKMGKDLIVIDYDDMIRSKYSLLPRVYSFLGLPGDQINFDLIHGMSLSKASRLSQSARKQIYSTCWPIYEAVKKMAVQSTAAERRQNE